MLVLLDITADGFRLEQRQEIFIAARWQNCIRIGSAGQKHVKKGRVVHGDGIGEQRHMFAFGSRRRGMFAQQQSDLILVARG